MKYSALLSLLLCWNVCGVTLEDAVIAAYNYNADWLANQAERNAAKEQCRRADLVFFPTIEGALTSKRNGEDTTKQGQRDVLRSTATGMALNIRQNIFNSFQDVNNALSKKNSERAAYYALRKAEQDLLVGVVRAYTSVWAERQNLKAYKKKEDNLKKLYETQKVCLAAGMSTPADVAEAESRYQTAVYERVNEETQVVAAEATFKQITGLEADKRMNLPEIRIAIPKDANEMKKKALATNPEVLRAKFAEQSALNDLSASKGELGPKCDLVLSASRKLDKYEPRLSAYHDSSNNNYSAELSVTVPILNMPSYANVGYHSEKAKQAKFSLESKNREVERNCEVYLRTYIAAKASIQANRTAVKSAEITSESNLDQSTFGMKSNTEFLDGETALLTARINLAKAIKEKIDVQIQVAALTGSLDLVSVLSACRNK